ncbi:MAG: hypothetical protein ACRDTU_22430 [Micromonosporaceae bacterium]
MSFQTSALLLSWVAIALLALVVSGLVRQVHTLSTGATRRPDRIGLRPGSPAPELRRLLPGHGDTVVLLFLEPDCGTCGEVLAEAARHPVPVRAIYRQAGPADPPVPVHEDEADLFDAYDALATPYAVVVDRDGRVARSEPVGSRAALRTLFSELTSAATGTGSAANAAGGTGSAGSGTGTPIPSGGRP